MQNVVYIRLVHISDLHFGPQHVCCLDEGTSIAGVPTLTELLSKDLCQPAWADKDWWYGNQEAPVFLTITGDITERAEVQEFDSALEFITDLTSKPILDSSLSRNQVFIVPGNHDVVFTSKSPDRRFQPFCSFYNHLYEELLGNQRIHSLPHRSSELSRVHYYPQKNFVVAEVNSCMYVEQGTIDASRGQIDFAAIANLRSQLDDIGSELSACIKIAIVHHHPILIPALVEQRHGYDAIVNANSLLRILQDYGFHLVLHGHKHFPHVFTFDPDSSWNPEESRRAQLLIVAGGSIGSKALPPGTRACNTYNVVSIMWHPEAKQGRAQVVTRGLRRMGHDGMFDPDLWRWETLRIFDRTLTPYSIVPNSGWGLGHEFKPEDRQRESLRTQVYKELRGNMPVVEVMPSLMPRQAYEARAWIVPHTIHKESPRRVVWSAGEKFRVHVCERDTNPIFAASIHYWGPMLIQAELEFDDGQKAYSYIYARIPKSEEIAIKP